MNDPIEQKAILLRVKGPMTWRLYPEDAFIYTPWEQELMRQIEEEDEGVAGLTPETPDGLYWHNRWPAGEDEDMVEIVPVQEEDLEAAWDHVKKIEKQLGQTDPEPTFEEQLFKALYEGAKIGFVVGLCVVLYKNRNPRKGNS